MRFSIPFSWAISSSIGIFLNASSSFGSFWPLDFLSWLETLIFEGTPCFSSLWASIWAFFRLRLISSRTCRSSSSMIEWPFIMAVFSFWDRTYEEWVTTSSFTGFTCWRIRLLISSRSSLWRSYRESSLSCSVSRSSDSESIILDRTLRGGLAEGGGKKVLLGEAGTVTGSRGCQTCAIDIEEGGRCF